MNNKKTAVVTGGSRGIGRAICLKLAKQGINIVLNYAGNHESAEQTKADCEALGASVTLVRGDVSIMEDCERIFSAAIEYYGRVDILVNNAGITRDNLIIRMSEQDFDKVIGVNLKGAWNCMKLASRIMIRQRFGRIVNITSVVGVTGNAGQSNYAASKAGVIGMTKSMAKELAARGITVNAVAPGYIDTDMTAVMSDEIKERVKSAIPMQNTGKGADVAALVSFFAGDDSAYITGQLVHVDGGLAM